MNDRDLEELLRSRSEPLRPPPGKWETVRRRARRRRIVKLSATVLATVVVIGGGLTPLLLMDDDHPSGQRLSIAAGPTSTTIHLGPDSPEPAPARKNATAVPPTATAIPNAPASTSSNTAQPALAGLHPQSVSFVSQDQGFLLGRTAASRVTLASTADAGRTWSHLATLPSSAKDAGVRFATPLIGFLFGASYAVTTDGGRSWATQQSPGYISDLETMDGHVYALVTPCARCRRVALYDATTAAPALHRVATVPPMVGDAVSVSVYKDSAYLLDTVKGGAGTVWSTLDGSRWSQQTSPCGTTMGLVTQWSNSGVAAACDVRLFGSGRESKQVFVSTDGARTWTPLATPPTKVGYINSVSASGPGNVVVGDDQSGLDVTTDGGKSWSLRGPSMSDGASFVGFISDTRVVALPQDPSDRFFTTSYDAGLTWVTTSFPN
jgi:photosystem II stability/assembly factor-like uncharacterized protein